MMSITYAPGGSLRRHLTAQGYPCDFLQRLGLLNPPGCDAFYRRPRTDMSRLRVKVPKRNIVPLSVDEVGRFWLSFRSSRDLAIVGLVVG